VIRGIEIEEIVRGTKIEEIIQGIKVGKILSEADPETGRIIVVRGQEVRIEGIDASQIGEIDLQVEGQIE